MLSCYTTAARRAIALAVGASAAAEDGYVGSGHLLWGLLHAETEGKTPCIAAKLLRAHPVSVGALSAALSLSAADAAVMELKDEELPEMIDAAKPLFTPILVRILSRAEEEAERFLLEHNGTAAVIGTEHLLFALLCEPDAAAHHALAAQNLPLHELYGDVLSFLSAVTAEEAIFSSKSDTTHSKDAEKTSAAPSPYLTDMTALAAAGKYDTVVGRDDEEESVLRILLHRQKNNPCLLGEAGVGKTAIVEGLAARIAHGAVPKRLSDARIYALDLGGMLAGAKYRGEFEERLKGVLAFCREQNRRAIVFIDEMHMLMGAGAAEGGTDAANLLKPALSRGEIRIIGATTVSEYDKTVARDGAMSRRFQTVHVEEPSGEGAFAMLAALREKLQAHHGVRIPDETLRCAIETAVRCLPQYFLPDKAIDLLDDACAAVHSQPTDAPLSAQKRRDEALLAGNFTLAQSICQDTNPDPAPPPTVVSKEDILRAAERRTGIALTSDAELRQTYQALEARLSARVFGQDEAIAQIAQLLRRRQTALLSDDRPTASFLFLGPRGVGKTAVCEAIADLLFHTPHALLQFDMSEYRDAHTASRLIGAPPGYVGHEDGGTLTTAVKHRPYALLLFEGIEYAHPDVLRLLSQILGRGSLTDSRGTTVSFRHTILIMTSAHTAAPPTVGFHTGSADDTSPDIQWLPKDLLCRIDAVVRFHPLSEDSAHRILASRLSLLADRLSARGITFSFDDAALPVLYRQTTKPRGAADLIRTVSEQVESPIARALSDGTLAEHDICTLAADNDTLRLHMQHSQP